MIRGQRHGVGEQQIEPPSQRTSDLRQARIPNQPVMHDDEVGVELDGAMQQFSRCRNAGDHGGNVRCPLDLKAIWAIVAEPADFEHRIEMADDIAERKRHAPRMVS